MTQPSNREPMPIEAFNVEFDRQVDVLVNAGFHSAAGLSRQVFMGTFEPLRRNLAQTVCGGGSEAVGSARFVLVVTPQLAPAETLVPLLRWGSSERVGIIDPNHGPDGLATYRPLADLAIPSSDVYAIVDVQRGEEFCGVTPKDATEQIVARGRSVLTIHEGISLVATHPDLLEKNKCFMLAGSRQGNKRVPALWISDKAPKLGWCWESNPHSWLGTASLGQRLSL